MQNQAAEDIHTKPRARADSGVRRVALPAKLSPPSVAAAIARPRLFRVLDRRTTSATWLHAPAGAGKSLLLASYLQAREAPSLWYRAEAGDTEAELLHYLRLAVEGSVDGGASLPRLRPGLGPSARQGLVRTFCETLVGLLPEGASIVVDDYQHAGECEGFHRAVAALLDATTGTHVRLLVTSRSAPPLAMAAACGSGHLAVLEWADLRLDEREVRRLVAAHGQPSPLQSAELTAITGGWAIAVSLLSRSRDARAVAAIARPVAPTLSGGLARRAAETDERVFVRLAGELLDRLDVPCRELLLAVAPMPSFSARMAAALCPQHDVEALLARLHEDHLLLERHGERAFRMHDLMRKLVLRRAIAQAGPDAFRAHAVRAAALLADDGQHAAAFELLERASAWDALADAIESHAPQLAMQSRIESIGDALARLPADQRGARPWLVLWDAVATVGSPGPRALALAERALASMRSVADPIGALFAWSIAVQATVLEGEDFTRLPAWLDMLSELSPALAYAPPPVAVSVAKAEVLAHAFGEAGTPRAKDAAERALRAMRTHGDADDLVEMSAAALLVFYMGGEQARAEDMRRFAAQRCEEASGRARPRLAYLHSHAILEVARARFSQGARVAHEALALAEASGVDLWNASLTMVAVTGHIGARTLDVADELLDRMSVAAATGTRLARSEYAFGRAWATFERGDIDGARRWLEAAMRETERLGFRFSSWHEHLALVIFAGAHGDRDALTDALARLERVMQGAPCAWVSAAAELARAHGALCLGDDPSEPLARGLRQLKALGPTTPAFLGPTAITRLALAALERGIEVELARALLRDHGPAASAPASSQQVRVRTFGGLEVEVAGSPLCFGRKAPVTLLSLLSLLASSEPLSAMRLTQLLWPAHGQIAAKGVLHTALYRLRKLLGHEGAIETSCGHITLSQDLCWTDVRALRACCDAVAELARERSPAPEIVDARERELLDLYRGPFAPGDTRPPINRARERLRRAFERASAELASTWRALGDEARAAQLEQRAVTLVGC